MEDLLQTILSTYLIPALMTFLTGFVTWLGTRIKQKYDENIKNEEVRKIVKQVVQYVEQKYETLKGEEKYKIAFENASSWLAQKGIEISVVELDTLIESSVYELTGSLKGNEPKEEDR